MPLRSVRRAVARTMARAWAENPPCHPPRHGRRDRAGAAAPPPAGGGGRGRAAADADTLPDQGRGGGPGDHPRFNASLDTEAEEIVLHREIHIRRRHGGPIGGLLVPVVRDAGTKDNPDPGGGTGRADRRRQGRQPGARPAHRRHLLDHQCRPLGGSFFTPTSTRPRRRSWGVGRAALTPVAEGDLDDWGLVARLMLAAVGWGSTTGAERRGRRGALSSRTWPGCVADPETAAAAGVSRRDRPDACRYRLAVGGHTPYHHLRRAAAPKRARRRSAARNQPSRGDDQDGEHQQYQKRREGSAGRARARPCRASWGSISRGMADLRGGPVLLAGQVSPRAEGRKRWGHGR